VDDDGFRLHKRTVKSLGSTITEIVALPTAVRPVKACDPAFSPKGQVENGDVAIPNQRFGISARGSKIKGVRNPIRALSAPGRDDDAHPWIA
jgi:hypothetical protein